MEWRKGNTFATTAFLSYGLFWFSLVALIILPKSGWATASNDTAMAAYLFIWGLFTAVMLIVTLRLHVAGQVVFGSLTILFFLLTIGDFVNAGPGFKQFTGYEEFSVGSPRSTQASRRCSRGVRQSHPAARSSNEVVENCIQVGGRLTSGFLLRRNYRPTKVPRRLPRFGVTKFATGCK